MKEKLKKLTHEQLLEIIDNNYNKLPIEIINDINYFDDKLFKNVSGGYSTKLCDYIMKYNGGNPNEIEKIIKNDMGLNIMCSYDFELNDNLYYFYPLNYLIENYEFDSEHENFNNFYKNCELLLKHGAKPYFYSYYKFYPYEKKYIISCLLNINNYELFELFINYNNHIQYNPNNIIDEYYIKQKELTDDGIKILKYLLNKNIQLSDNTILHLIKFNNYELTETLNTYISNNLNVSDFIFKNIDNKQINQEIDDDEIRDFFND